ncbi:MAG: RNA polymerase sigma-70 factor [Tannerella sp.]|jgi:RNA polymerase sigma-70 factor (ECF subfamily)|nr:RNA polymerase sigma-70 factor [Tannerella sp.]
MSTGNHVQSLLALEELFKSYYKPLRAYAYRFINNKEIAEDIVQDIFFEVWSHHEKIHFDDKKAVKSYLFKSVYNRSINLINSSILYGNTSIEDTNEELIIETYLSQYIPNQEQSLLLKELESEIADFVETLPSQCKKIFVLSRTYGLKNKEIAEKLEISIKAVEKQISKALSGLKTHLLKKELLFICYLFHQLF